MIVGAFDSRSAAVSDSWGTNWWIPPTQQFCATLDLPRWSLVDSGCVSRAGHTALHQHNPVPPLESAFVFLWFHYPPKIPHPTTGKKEKKAVCWFSSLGWVRQATAQAWGVSWDQSSARLDSLKMLWKQLLRAQSIFLLQRGIPSSSCLVLHKWQHRGTRLRCTIPLQHNHSDFTRKQCDFFLGLRVSCLVYLKVLRKWI